jgi:4-hydroxybenzoate polyprenyltransferase
MVLLPVFFAGGLFDLKYDELIKLTLTFLAFCFSSSMIYVINDINDRDKDRLHPKKSNRPIASGKVSISESVFIIVFLALLILTTLFLLQSQVVYFVIAYIIMNLLYCFGMKDIAIIDVTSISLGFVFRLMAGGKASDTLTTHWIIILVFLLMFSIALAKRRDDLILTEGSNEIYRKSQSGYTIQFIDIVKTISFSVTLVAYIIYSVSDDVISRLGSNYVFITSLPVFLGIMRYIQLTVVFKNSGSPVDLLLKDKFLIATVISWIVLFTSILYV